MKKLLFIIAVFVAFSVNAQETTERKNELKINMSNLIGFKWLDVGYERILNEESSIGISTLFSLDNDPDDGDGLDEYRTFSLTPYYRHFFSKKYAQGFFVEAFTMLHSGKEDVYYDYYDQATDTYYYSDGDKYTDLAVGISAGAKFMSKRGFIAEIYLGIGRDLLGNSDIEVVGRGGVSIGYRFQ